jgi:hypothetical protein
MSKNSNWGHIKINLENQSRSEQRKGLEELGKQENTFNKLLDKLKQNARRETDKDSKGNS